MHLTVHIYYTGQGEAALNFAREMIARGVVERVRKEAGNLQYDYFLPIGDRETVLLVDKWENEEALDRHHRSEMMKEIAALRTKYHLRMRVEKFRDSD